ncbi:hypothetical protein VTO42DRAFT_1484 [Malbranchea cinnamomea]
MTAPRVLLLGGHGKVALHLTPLLLNRGWNVTSVVRNPEHEQDILRFNDHEGRASGGDRGGRGTVNVLVSSLDDVQNLADAERVIEKVRPDYVVWAAGAGGKGGPARTYAVDQDAAKHFIRASLADLNISKFLLISHLGSRRQRAPWWTDDDWAAVQRSWDAIPHYCKAKLEADEYFAAMALKRKEKEREMGVGSGSGNGGFQGIVLRPGLLTLEPATRKVQLGKTKAGGSVTREDVAIVADALLAREDTRGFLDLLGGEDDVTEAVERVVTEKIDAIEGEDVEGITKRFQGEPLEIKT